MSFPAKAGSARSAQQGHGQGSRSSGARVASGTFAHKGWERSHIPTWKQCLLLFSGSATGWCWPAPNPILPTSMELPAQGPPGTAWKPPWGGALGGALGWGPRCPVSRLSRSSRAPDGHGQAPGPEQAGGSAKGTELWTGLGSVQPG